MYIYIHTSIYTYIHIYIYIYTHIYICIYMNKYIYISLPRKYVPVPRRTAPSMCLCQRLLGNAESQSSNGWRGGVDRSYGQLCVLQCVAGRCSVLQGVAVSIVGVDGSHGQLCVFRCVAGRCRVLQCQLLGLTGVIVSNGVATMSRLHKIIGLFCRT